MTAAVLLCNMPSTDSTHAAAAPVVGSALHDLVGVAVTVSSTSHTVASVTDTQSNAYSNIGMTGSPAPLDLYFDQDSAALTTGDTITVLFGQTGNHSAVAFKINGLSTTSAFDKASTSATGTTTVALGTTSTGTLAQANEVLVAVLSCTANPGTISNLGSWTLVGSASTTSRVFVYTQEVASNANVDFAPTLQNLVNSHSRIFCFRKASIPPPTRGGSATKRFHFRGIQVYGAGRVA